ncbi:MAG: hypothetical protein ABFE07_29105 [Armatimonadia bacterium]
MFAAFRDEIEKLANPLRKSNFHSTDPSINTWVESMHQWMARPEVKTRIEKRYSATPRSAADRAGRFGVKAPAPAPAVKAEAASGKAGLSKLFRFVGEHKKLFGAVGGVAAGGALAATMAKLMKKKAPAPPPATPTND